MKSYMKKGFTLIELLVVVGILAILAIAALIAINPLEAQRRSRDSARLQDMARLSAATEAFMNDYGNGDATVGLLPTALVQSSGAGTAVRSQPCNGTSSGNWLGVNLCPYLKQVPLDPNNGRVFSTISTATGTTRADTPATGGSYGFITSNGQYEFCTRLEAEKNRELLNDGGNASAAFETGTVVSLNCTP